MSDPTPIQTRQQPPVSATPLRDYLTAQPLPGVTPDYVVVPRVLAENMPLPWQQQAAHLIEQLHHDHAQAPWPLYRVDPSRRAALTACDEHQLTEVGASVELDDQGELVYRDARTGQLITDPEARLVLVPCPDPLQASDHRVAGRGAVQAADRGRAPS